MQILFQSYISPIQTNTSCTSLFLIESYFNPTLVQFKLTNFNEVITQNLIFQSYISPIQTGNPTVFAMRNTKISILH